jgi:hypothetical protein
MSFKTTALSLTSPLRTGTALTALALTVAFTTGCAKTADEVRDDIDREAQQLSVNDMWLAPCENAKLDWIGVSSKVERYEFGASLTKWTILFEEDSCSTPSIEIAETGDYNIGNKTATEAYILDLNYRNVSVKALNEAGRDLLNTVQACGINDWAVGQGRDVTHATNDGAVLGRCWTKAPRQLFDIVRVSGDNLQFGYEENGLDKSVPEKRPTRVENSVVFVRQ